MSSPFPEAAPALSQLRSNPRIIDVATSPLLTPAECGSAVADCDASAWRTGAVGAATSADAISGSEVLGRVDLTDKSRVEQPIPGGNAGWLAERIAERVCEINTEIFGFRIVGFEDPMRVLWYRGESGDHYGEHLDIGPQFSLRKLAFSLLLSDPAAYEGGDLVFGKEPIAPARVQGTIAVFAAFLPHRVTRMVSGSRHVATGWAIGPSFV